MVAEQINQIVDMVAEKLGVAVEAVYPMLIKQAEVFCSTYHITLWIASISLAMIVVGTILYYIANNGKWNETLETISAFILVIFTIALITSGIISMFEIREYFTALHNPEWWAIEYVTKLVK